MRILVQVIKTFSRAERWTCITAFLIFISSFIFFTINFLLQNTSLVPVPGGEHIEGLMGQPSFVNPVLVGNNEPDQDLIRVIFSNLLGLAEHYKMSADGKVWNIRLKENLFWHDGRAITTDDVVFTIKIIQDPDSHSPLFPMWQAITVERVSELEIKLLLPEPYVFFESTLKELRPIPKHLFGAIPVANLRLSDYNLEPIGSGPFKFTSFQKERSGFISEYRLGRNENYFHQKPYLKELVFKFYQGEEKLIEAFNSGAVDAFGGLDQKNLSKVNINHQIFEIRMPRYYAIFFNPYTQPAFKDKNVRLALNYATDKERLVKNIFDNQALVVDGPLMPGMKGYDVKIYPEENFSLEKAEQVLDVSGWQMTEEGIREKTAKKESQRLEFNLVVPQIAFLVEAANLLQEDWSKIGVKLNLIIRPPAEINEEIIKTRNYEMIIFGNVFSSGDNPDLSSFWHSAERFYPGLNLALYENKTADSLIESIRKTLNNSKRQADLSTLQSLIIQDLPAIFLFSPHYFYLTKSSLKGFDERFIPLPSDRFENIEQWYVKTARVFK